MHPQTINNYLKENHLYSINTLSKSLGVGRTSLNRIIKIYNLKEKSVKFGNLNLYTEEMKSEIIELIKMTSRYLNHHSKDKVEGYIKVQDVLKYFNIKYKKLNSIMKYYNLTSYMKRKGIWYINNEDFEFLKKLPKDSFIKNYIHANSKKQIKEYLISNNYLTINELAKQFNITTKQLNYLMSHGNVNLPYKIYKGLHVYDDKCKRILKEYFEKKEHFEYTIASIARFLNCSEVKVKNYMNYLKPTKDEFDGKYYTQEFVDKMKRLMINHPTLIQNKVYVEGYDDICFDSRCEAIFYVYMKEHDYDIKYHPINFEYFDNKGIKRTYEVDFSVNGRLIELKGNDKFDKNGNPIFRGKDWSKKLECMKEHNVLMIKSKQFENHGCLKFMSTYFGENHTIVKCLIDKIKEEVHGVTEEDKKYRDLLKRAIRRHKGLAIKCIETSEIHFKCEWKKLLNVKNLDMEWSIKGKHYKYATYEEHRSYILSKIEELRIKGLDISWFEENEEKYFPKIIDEKQKDITIFDM